MPERIYIEIGNICNLACSFCPKTSREPRQMTRTEFKTVLEKTAGRVKFIYLHVMGEPLLHGELDGMLADATEAGLAVCITTNGTLLAERGDILLRHADIIHKISISLHAPEGNLDYCPESYLIGCTDFAKQSAEAGIYTVFRLWNMPSGSGEGAHSENGKIENHLRAAYPEPWQSRPRGYRIAERTFLEYDGIFTWPIESTSDDCERLFCHALESQLAILADGTAVPCCLDSEGKIPLGNIFSDSLEDILSSPRAKAIREGFAHGKAIDPLCKKCTYARRFKVRNN